jgi:hypothetical protein
MGFGFSIYPVAASIINESNDLDKENIVKGSVLERMNAVLRMKEVPVIQSVTLVFSGKERAGTSHDCRYGSTNL